jgi:hypothetical protein
MKQTSYQVKERKKERKKPEWRLQYEIPPDMQLASRSSNPRKVSEFPRNPYLNHQTIHKKEHLFNYNYMY